MPKTNMRKEPIEYKEGDTVKIKGFKSPGIIVGHKDDCYHIELSSPCPIKFIEYNSMRLYFEPKTYIKKMDVHVGLISPINKQEE